MTKPSQIVLPCSDLETALTFYTETAGFRLDMIMPADAPRVAELSGFGLHLRLELAEHSNTSATPIRLQISDINSHTEKTVSAPDGVCIEWCDPHAMKEMPTSTQEFIISRALADNVWGKGRAGMQYRDLIPGRLGGRYIASHIRIPQGGPVPDYVHFHQVGFQMIYCKRGWVRVVYEDQGPPFVMHAGDCVLQPPTIRHRVLEASDGLEVIEIGCPAEHETFREHLIELPTEYCRPERLFGGQLFARHIAGESPWVHADGLQFQDTGMAKATNDYASTRVLRLAADSSIAFNHTRDFLFLFVLDGDVDLSIKLADSHQLSAGDSVCLPKNCDYVLTAKRLTTLLEVSVA
jgi:quercetin dioxygenase-like cupin family protein